MLTKRYESASKHCVLSKASSALSDSGQNANSIRLAPTRRKTCYWPPKIAGSRHWKQKIASSKRN